MELVHNDVLPMPDELDPQEESPYLRRQKSVPMRRSRISRRVRLALFVVAVLRSGRFSGLWSGDVCVHLFLFCADVPR